MEIPWTTTPSQLGPIPADNYLCTIGGLCANSIYEYRAYMVVNGIPYYGDILSTNTLQVPNQAPHVTTGDASAITLGSMRIADSTVDDKGLPATITEYGILYSQNPSIDLVYGGVGVNMESIVGDIGTGVQFFSDSLHDLTPLLQNTETYYRAFAKNSANIGYGLVKVQQTAAPTSQSVNLSSGDILLNSSTMICASAKLVVEPQLTAGQSFRLCFIDSACSVSNVQTRNMFACSELRVVSSHCNCVRSLLNDNIGMASLSSIDEQSDYIDVDCTNINNLTFYLVGQSHSSNAILDYYNYAGVCLTSIVNQVGGAFELGDPQNQYASVCSASVNNGGLNSYHLPNALA